MAERLFSCINRRAFSCRSPRSSAVIGLASARSERRAAIEGGSAFLSSLAPASTGSTALLVATMDPVLRNPRRENKRSSGKREMEISNYFQPTRCAIIIEKPRPNRGGAGSSRYNHGMLSGFQCAGCGEWNDTTVDEAAGSRQSYIEDCQVCCKPNILRAQYDRATGEFVIAAELE